MIRAMPSAISLNTPLEDLHRFKIARLGENLARKLAAAVASHANKKHFSEANVEDLLSYLPMRYEDRSHLATIQDLEAGMEATLELQVKHAGGYQVRNTKAFSKSRLFILKSRALISTTRVADRSWCGGSFPGVAPTKSSSSTQRN
jgi:RecG-like helicase